MAIDSSLEGRHISKFTQNSTKSLQNSREVPDATSTCSRGMRRDARQLYEFDSIRTVWTLEYKKSLTLD